MAGRHSRRIPADSVIRRDDDVEYGDRLCKVHPERDGLDDGVDGVTCEQALRRATSC